MKIAKKTYLYLAVVAVGVVLILVSQVKQVNKRSSNDTVFGVSPSPSTSVRVSPHPSPRLSPGPTPGIKAEMVINRYKDLVAQLGPENRRLAIDSSCSTIVPSNLIYKNNTQVMLDNTASVESRTLKIGDRSYELAARGWYITTLYSAKLPAKLTIFCGKMELGQIDLE